MECPGMVIWSPQNFRWAEMEEGTEMINGDGEKNNPHKDSLQLRWSGPWRILIPPLQGQKVLIHEFLFFFLKGYQNYTSFTCLNTPVYRRPQIRLTQSLAFALLDSFTLNVLSLNLYLPCWKRSENVLFGWYYFLSNY